MDVDECTDDDELFEHDAAEAMDEEDPAPGKKGGDEDRADDDDADADYNPVPKPKARSKVTKEGHKGKAKHPNFLIEGPALGGRFLGHNDVGCHTSSTLRGRHIPSITLKWLYLGNRGINSLQPFFVR